MPPLLLAEAETLALYGPLLLLLFAAIGFGFGNLLLTHLFGPRRKETRKGLVYESGMNPIGDTKKRFNVRFFVVAMTFLLFSIEIAFLHPWASVFGALSAESGLHGVFLARMLFFVLTSVIAFAYAWRKGVFRYD
ncbi:NADH-quinone oxidoreductase subunit A [Phycisphaera mikurensis]|uniref:NADH-quinone oxidoreductase subunit n=1 Tax=Phycisphaera mikurensis (strain NBRC 102666 / KCTC 22515 / FYK2301M01) TaxID=1142394 RepID=I0IGA4_PHYMF|nr:NADH-quinone oxidoreductase subunit A [Phycisphaera mikurensis]MBB6440326.1 NADH-quinone oxidoreductase subunit A [Phycisphaera mikurensis]BAM04292.1 putative NADH-quinone oxidoreductase subunit A [Phycisphaera mikurensis NBRC 102666]